jgi:hypothetical protein
MKTINISSPDMRVFESPSMFYPAMLRKSCGIRPLLSVASFIHDNVILIFQIWRSRLSIRTVCVISVLATIAQEQSFVSNYLKNASHTTSLLNCATGLTTALTNLVLGWILSKEVGHATKVHDIIYFGA